VQAQLVAAVHRQHWAFALQDLRCIKCKQVLDVVQGLMSIDAPEPHARLLLGVGLSHDGGAYAAQVLHLRVVRSGLDEASRPEVSSNS